MKTLGQFIAERRRELGMSGREVVARIKKADGSPISIPYLVDLEHDRRKPSDEVLEQFAKVLQADSDIMYFLAGRIPPDLHTKSLKEDDLAAAFRAFRREVKREKKP
jgi:transcriptional regulator with XRE-family HTH domain